MEYMIGAIIVTHDGEEGMIVDKILSYCNSSNYTTYLVMKNDKSTLVIEPEDISIIKNLSGQVDFSSITSALPSSLNTL